MLGILENNKGEISQNIKQKMCIYILEISERDDDGDEGEKISKDNAKKHFRRKR